MEKTIEEIQKQLAEPMDYKTRVWPWWKELAYIDARQAQDRLDEVCWIDGWKVDYKELRWELFAWVSIKLKVWVERIYNNLLSTNSTIETTPKYEWITKWDWWSESNIEKEKGAISDSFKRACVVWWLWRFLYSIKPTWKPKTDPKDTTKIKYLNYEDLVEIVNAWNTTEQAIASIIKEDWYTLSNQAKIAVRHYVDNWEILKNLFFKPK